jgi:hypothetical protein
MAVNCEFLPGGAKLSDWVRYINKFSGEYKGRDDHFSCKREVLEVVYYREAKRI